MKPALKGLVISGGKGSRLRPLTYTGAKQLVPIANKPILFYAVENLVDAGVREITVVVSPENGEQIRAAVGDGVRFGAHIGFVEQAKPGGIAQAIGVARQALGGAPFIAFLGDNFLTDGVLPYAEAFAASADDAAVLLKHVDDAREFGVAQFDGERLVRVVEKPAEPPSDLAVIGIYLFTSRVFDAIESITPSARGELEITDTIQWLIDHGHHVRADVVDGDWIDTGKHDDLLAANRLVLERLADDPSGGAVDGASKLHGRVVLQQGSEIVNSVISGPAIIGERTRIENSYVGPFTSIGPDCRIVESELAGSVVMDHTAIERLGHRIEHSLIGRHVQLAGDDRKPRGYQMVLGDHSRVRVP
ncbi:MAG TPA: glucose-1-phosphate thymidylyltransferase [Dehalococcoidia bacterium]|nr:glucose-1-phosphate thymidylyltransferase [Dehalococcoidia bacterium]